MTHSSPDILRGVYNITGQRWTSTQKYKIQWGNWVKVFQCPLGV